MGLSRYSSPSSGSVDGLERVFAVFCIVARGDIELLVAYMRVITCR